MWSCSTPRSRSDGCRDPTAVEIRPPLPASPQWPCHGRACNNSPMSAAQPLITLIVAMAQNGVIGRANALPWRLPRDLQRFKAFTLGKAVLMGRRTFESIGRPLPQRTNLVLTRDRAWYVAGSAPTKPDTGRTPHVHLRHARHERPTARRPLLRCRARRARARALRRVRARVAGLARLGRVRQGSRA